jgi:hypothetical protein
MYDPHRDLYAVLGVPAGALPQEIRGAICRRYATARVHDLEEASRLLLSTGHRARYDLERFHYRARAVLHRLWHRLRRLAPLTRLLGEPVRRRFRA